MRIERGIVIGNVTDKAEMGGFAGRYVVAQFDRALVRAAISPRVQSVHEVGCGEGRLARLLAASLSLPITASDFSETLIQENIARCDENIRYLTCSIYDLEPSRHKADLVVCCEVLEHLDDPERAARTLASLGAAHYILSVPEGTDLAFIEYDARQILVRLGQHTGTPQSLVASDVSNLSRS